MTLGQWLNSLSVLDHIILLIMFLAGVLLSRISLNALIKYYEKKTNYSEYRKQFRITPFFLLILAMFYSTILYISMGENITKWIRDF